MKVLSLIASSTEMVAALGQESLLVGRSHECDFPTTVRALPQVTRPSIDVNGTSREIDERVKGRLKDALSIYEVDRELLGRLAPDVILTQTQCEVCAVSLKDVEDSLVEWTGKRPQVVSLSPNSLADIWEDFRRVARALRVEAVGERVIATLQGEMRAIERIASRIMKRDGRKPRVACIEWTDPLMAAGNWNPELVAMAGAENLFGEAGRHSPWMTVAELAARDPDVIIVSPCGFDLARTRQEMPALLAQPGFSDLRAVREGKLFLADGNQYFNRPGPRVVVALRILAEILYPRDIPAEWQGTGWSKR